MLYNTVKESIEHMIEEIYAGKEECSQVISFNLIRDQNIPISMNTKMLYPLGQVKISLYCSFLLVEPDVVFEEIFKKDEIEDELRLMRLVAKFTTILEKLRSWVKNEVPDMIRWGEGVIFDKNGRTKKIPYPVVNKEQGNVRGKR